MTSYTIDLRIEGDTLIAHDISEILKLQPTRIEHYGWRTLSNGEKAPALWIYDGSSENQTVPEWENLEHAIDFIYKAFKSKIFELKILKEKFKVYLWLGCFTDTPMSTAAFSIEIIQKINDLNIQLYFETYLSTE